MKYILLCDDNCRLLTDKVKGYLNRGWVIKGPAFTDKYTVYQTMVKY